MSENKSEQDGNSSVEFYAPVLRDGYIERDIMGEFAGFSRFEADRLDILPIIEVTEEGDLDNLVEYAQAGTPVLVDAPRYLTETDEPNGLTDEVENLLSSAGGAIDFLNHNADTIDVPVVSGPLDLLFNYTYLLEFYNRLSEDYDRAALRVFVPSTELEDWQLEDLRTIEAEITTDDIVLLDYFETGDLGPSATGRENLVRVSEVFENQRRVILDAFNVFDGINYNFGPAIAEQAGVEGFGDFAGNQRYPPADDIPMGLHDTRTIRHYDFEDREVVEFKGEGFSGLDSASQELRSWEKWNPDHCEFCEEAERGDREGFRFWKRVRVGHYINSVLREEA